MTASGPLRAIGRDPHARPVLLCFDASPASRLALLAAWLRGHGGSALARTGPAALLAASLGLGHAVWQVQTSSAQADVQVQEAREAQARNHAVSAQTPPVNAPSASLAAQSRTDAAAAAERLQALRLLDTPWTALLDTLEETLPADVALVAIEPDGRPSRVRLQAEARSLQTLLAYAQALGSAPGVMDSLPLQHEIRESEPGQPVRLTVQATLAAPPAAVNPATGGVQP